MGASRKPLTAEQRHRFLMELEAHCNALPDMRLGQLIYNAVGFWLLWNKRAAAERDIAHALFYLEDDDLLTTVAKFLMEKYPPKAATSS